MTNTTSWTCRGPVRGACGISHRGEIEAERCCAKDDRDCKRGSGKDSYSDRVPVPYPSIPVNEVYA